MSRLMPGNFTVFRASHTLDSKSFAISRVSFRAFNRFLAIVPPVPRTPPQLEPGQLGDAGADLPVELRLAPQPVVGGEDGRAVGDDGRAGADGPVAPALDVPGPADAHRHDGQADLQGQQEAAALEGQERVGERAGALGEQEDGRARAQPGHRRGEGLAGGAAVRPVDRDEAARLHGPAEQGDHEQGPLGHHADLARGRSRSAPGCRTGSGGCRGRRSSSPAPARERSGSRRGPGWRRAGSSTRAA